jgi:DNA-3-methyladenine glycosylase II
MIGWAMETIEPLGRFSLRAAAAFGFGPTEGRPPSFDGAMRLAFCVDGGGGYAGAVLRQRSDDGPVGVELTLREGAPREAALAQVARTVSLDHDGAAFGRIGDHDPVIGALQHAHPGQRPVLFGSPYEAAAWSVISARRPAAQGAKVRAALSQRLGRTFELVGRTLHAFPQPSALAQIPDTSPASTTPRSSDSASCRWPRRPATWTSPESTSSALTPPSSNYSVYLGSARSTRR